MKVLRISDTRYVWLMIAVSSALALGVPCSAAVTMDGFITNIDSATSFDVRGTHVLLNDDAKCETETLDEAIVLKRKIYDGVRAHMYFILRDDLVPASVTETPCKALEVHVGTRMALTGEQRPTGVFAATHAVAYVVRNSKILSTQQNPGTLRGGAIFEEPPEVHHTAQGWMGSMWLDGYPMGIVPQTALSAAPAGSKLIYGFVGFARQPRFQVKPSSACESHSVPAGLFNPDMWGMYEGARAANGNISAARLCLWPNEANDDGTDKGNKRKHRNLWRVHLANYQLKRRGSIEMPHGRRLYILPDQQLQDWLSRLGGEIVPQSKKTLPDSDPAKIRFRFYVVHATDPTLQYAINIAKGWTYGMKRPGFDDAAIAMPGGLVAVSDSTLARIDNSAQLAAILSYAATSVLQKQASVRHDSLKYLGGGESGPSFTPYALAVLQDEQQMRIGIRQMYLAGYDIREAPFAWAVAQGKPVANPMINSNHPDNEIPWYAAYAFDYISQYYKDVDYSKLKRGRAEYQQFLQELYKADPSLPRPKAKE